VVGLCCAVLRCVWCTWCIALWGTSHPSPALASHSSTSLSISPPPIHPSSTHHPPIIHPSIHPPTTYPSCPSPHSTAQHSTAQHSTTLPKAPCPVLHYRTAHRLHYPSHQARHRLARFSARILPLPLQGSRIDSLPGRLGSRSCLVVFPPPAHHGATPSASCAAASCLLPVQ
jgi:hypothetical protein